MKLLWLTLADPHPADNGQFLYSAGLLRAAEMNGCAPCVIALRRPDVQGVKPSDSTVKWNLATHRPRSKWRALISRSPMLASRTKTATMRRLLRRHLRAESWDAIVFDGIAVGWAITPIIRQTSIQNRRPKLVYLSHNHEERVARFMARQGTSVFKRVARHIDAFKIARLERKLVRHADLVTANTPEDRAHFAEMRPGRAVEFVPPGYSGPLTEERSVGADTPRRAIIVGSFHWGPKQRSMESFLKAADPIFADAGVELLIVGDSEKAFLDRLRPQLRATVFTGRVDNVFPYMQQARVAAVPDTLGGFKLKTLDYVFNHLPIFAMEGSVPGLPLQDRQSIFLFPGHRELARGIVDLIDNFDRLNDVHKAAYALCHDRFDWERIGEELVAAIGRAGARNAAKSSPGSIPSPASI